MPTWTITTEDGDIVADGLDGALFDTAPGSEIAPSFVFWDPSDEGDPKTRHDTLQPFVDAAMDGVTVRVGRDSTGVPYYREDLSGFADVGSLLVSLVPASGRGGVWAVLRDGSDPDPGRGLADVFMWELQLTVLERFDAADDRATIETEYKDEVR